MGSLLNPTPSEPDTMISFPTILLLLALLAVAALLFLEVTK